MVIWILILVIFLWCRDAVVYIYIYRPSALGGSLFYYIWVVALTPELPDCLEGSFLAEVVNLRDPGWFWKATGNFLWGSWVALLLATCPGGVMNIAHSDKMCEADRKIIFYFSPVLCYHKISSSNLFMLAYIYYESAETNWQKWCLCLNVKSLYTGQWRVVHVKRYIVVYDVHSVS